MMKYYERAFTAPVLKGLAEYAERYEYDVYQQLIELTQPRSNTDYFTKTGRFSSKNRKSGWQAELKKLLMTSGPDIAQAAQSSDKTLIDDLEKIKVDIENWLLTSLDGKDFITSQGVEALIKELQTGKWYNQNPKNTSELIEGAAITNFTGIRKEGQMVSGLHSWLKNLDSNGVVIDTIDFDGRHEEGRFDILMKFSKNATHGHRRPIRIEAKSSVNDFVIGTLADELFKNATITIDPTSTQKVIVTLDRNHLNGLIDAYLKQKYSEAGEFKKANILPIFSDGSNFLLFSEFITQANNGTGNLFLGWDESLWTLNYWTSELLAHKIATGTYNITTAVQNKKIVMKLTYGKPHI